MSAEGRSTGGHRAEWLTTALLLLALVPLLLKVPAAASFTGAILAYPFQVDDSEGVVLSEAHWLAQGVDPYQPVRPDFFTAAPYTPIYTVLNALAFAIGPFTFKIGRGLALLATLAIAGIVGLLVRRRSGSLPLALWAALATLTLNLVSVWSVRARPDHLALALNLAGVALVYRRWGTLSAGAATGRWGLPRPETRLVWQVAGLCALGFFTKQTLLAAPVAIGVCLLAKRLRLGIAFGVLYGALVLIPFGLLILLTRGGFYQHIVAFHSSWSWHEYWRLGQPFLARYWPLLIVAAGLPLTVAALAVRTARPLAQLRDDLDLLPAVYLGTAALFGLGAGTHGGNHNHFVETMVVAVWCVALLAGRGLAAPR